jgi:multimeric flavodoxin WrbA
MSCSIEADEAGVDTELILLREKDIKACDGCLSCEAGGQEREGVCRIQDDMQQINPKLIQADGLASGTPVYFEMLSSLLKNFMDRTCPIWPRLELKPIVGIAVAEENIGKAVDNLRTYGLCLRYAVVAHVIALAKTLRQVSEDREVEKHLKRLRYKLITVLRAFGCTILGNVHYVLMSPHDKS